MQSISIQGGMVGRLLLLREGYISPSFTVKSCVCLFGRLVPVLSDTRESSFSCLTFPFLYVTMGLSALATKLLI